MNPVVIESVVTCPMCGFVAPENMPADARQFYCECTQCKSLLRPKPGDCRVFRSCGSVKRPPLQKRDCHCSS